MISNKISVVIGAIAICVSAGQMTAEAQQAYPSANSVNISAEDRAHIVEKLKALNKQVADLKEKVSDIRLVADVEVYAKAAEWILRHNEFYRPNYADMTLKVLETGLTRAQQLAAGKSPWTTQTGTVIRGYYSRVDGSVQPYALSLPKGVNRKSGKRWPLYVKLHGRGSTLNEVSFINRHDNKPLPNDQTWVQLDAFGRINNAYRWSGETDVFEAIRDAGRSARIDQRRTTLWGFSMGGAGSWHLGLHYPSKWSSVGPGAGFIDFYKYQKQTKKRPKYEHLALRIYDSIDYVLNAFDVPICTYGGENDAQLVASTSIVEEAHKLGVEIKLLIGPGVGHKFHPDSFKEFMAFHRKYSEKGRPAYPGRRKIRFVTHTLKYNQCEWVTIEEMLEVYQPAIVEGGVGRDGILRLNTQNVAVLQIARDIAGQVEINGDRLPLNTAAEGLLPGVYYDNNGKEWFELDYNASRQFVENPDLRKRRNLQGPIDDAFMESFVCVRGTGTPLSQANHNWAMWTLNRFEREFDKWLRGKISIIDDTQVTDELIANKNLILFGDPGSNRVLAKILDKLPITWNRESIGVNGKTYHPANHGLAMIYPNPLNHRRYIVINSGHTFHERDFRASNSWLFPRLGDIAVQKFEKNSEGRYDETTVWADMFNSSWKFRPSKTASAN